MRFESPDLNTVYMNLLMWYEQSVLKVSFKTQFLRVARANVQCGIRSGLNVENRS